MTIPRPRPIVVALSLGLLATAGCKRGEEASFTLSPLADVTINQPDAFYNPPGDTPKRPGVLLRHEPLRGGTLPNGMQGWRILYTTTVDDNVHATAVATVFAPVTMPAGPRPVITWAHGTTGVMRRCMPSLLSSPTEGIPARDQIVRAGWVVVATDYSFVEDSGPHPYLIGEGEARSLLDSVRAARQMPELKLDTRTVVWGHSQGGHAALWTGIIGPRYAPEVEIAGVAAIAPAANIKDILSMSIATDKRLGPYLALSYSRFYPDVVFDNAIRPEALEASRRIVFLCGVLPPEDPDRIAKLAASFDGPALALGTNKALEARLDQNTANGAIAAPVVIAQGQADVVVPEPATAAFVAKRCADGQRMAYWTFKGIDHRHDRRSRHTIGGTADYVDHGPICE